MDGTGPGEDYLVLDGPEPVGLVQYCRLADFPAYVEELSAVCPVPDGAASIDYLIGDATRTGHGLGTRMIEAFTERIWELHPGATCVVVPVVLVNPTSWRVLQSAGFRKIAEGHLEPDNPIDDAMHVVMRIDRPV